jgi:hypothetical protein
MNDLSTLSEKCFCAISLVPNIVVMTFREYSTSSEFALLCKDWCLHLVKE